VPVATASTGGLVFNVFTDSVSCIAAMYVFFQFYVIFIKRHEYFTDQARKQRRTAAKLSPYHVVRVGRNTAQPCTLSRATTSTTCHWSCYRYEISTYAAQRRSLSDEIHTCMFFQFYVIFIKRHEYITDQARKRRRTAAKLSPYHVVRVATQHRATVYPLQGYHVDHLPLVMLSLWNFNVCSPTAESERRDPHGRSHADLCCRKHTPNRGVNPTMDRQAGAQKLLCV